MARGGEPQPRRAPHGARRAGGQRVDRGGQARRRPRLGLVGHARRVRPLGRRHDEPGLPALLARRWASASPTPSTPSATARSASSGPSWRPSGSSSPAPASRSTRACSRIFGPPAEQRLVTASSTPCSASRLPGRRRVARARMAPDARRGQRAAASRTRATCAPAAIRRPRRSSSRTRRPSSASSWPSPASRCTRPPATRSTTAWRRWPSACCWRRSRWPSAATPRACSSARRRRPRSARRSPRSSRPIPPSTALLELLTMALAPDRLLVAARIDLADGLSADEIERASSELDRELRERIPDGVAGLPRRDASAQRGRAGGGRQAASDRRLSGRLIAWPARRRSRRRPAWRRRCASPRGPRGPRAGRRRRGRARARWPRRSRETST